MTTGDRNDLDLPLVLPRNICSTATIEMLCRTGPFDPHCSTSASAKGEGGDRK